MRRSAVVAALLLSSAASLAAAHLYPETITGWNAYVAATERRIARESTWQRAAPRDVLAGEVVVEPMRTLDERGELISVPSALVHHWRGAVFIPHMTAARLVAQLQNGAPPTRQEDVLESKVLERRPDWMRVSLKLQRKKIVTVVYNTEHLVTFTRTGAARATSASTATRIAEVSDANTPDEHELPIGDDRGFLWRLNAYWRYEDVPGGVIAECESITLSRDIPAIVKYFVTGLVERAARESMTRTLMALRTRFSAA